MVNRVDKSHTSGGGAGGSGGGTLSSGKGRTKFFNFSSPIGRCAYPGFGYLTNTGKFLGGSVDVQPVQYPGQFRLRLVNFTLWQEA